jgi:hypothetical protein
MFVLGEEEAGGPSHKEAETGASGTDVLDESRLGRSSQL